MSDNTPYHDVSDLAKTIIAILAEWQLDSQDQISMLGLPENTKARALTRMGTHGTAVVNEDFMDRARLILAIKNAVDSLYPHNTRAASLWITTPNYYFSNSTPATVMAVDGIEGMERVLNHLNGTEDW